MTSISREENLCDDDDDDDDDDDVLIWLKLDESLLVVELDTSSYYPHY
jgi:hypothetical protein